MIRGRNTEVSNGKIGEESGIVGQHDDGIGEDRLPRMALGESCYGKRRRTRMSWIDCIKETPIRQSWNMRTG